MTLNATAPPGQIDWAAGCCVMVGGAGGALQPVIVTESKQAALFRSVPAVWPSSQIVMEVPVATTVPLNGVQ